MVYTTEYASPLGPITLACDGEAIIGLWFNGQRYFGNILPEQTEKKRTPAGSRTRSAGWMCTSPDVSRSSFPRCAMTPRRSAADLRDHADDPVWKNHDLRPDRRRGREAAGRREDVRAGGRRRGRHNPISLMIPCHRVVGTSGSLTGYGGGIARKVKLLELEHADMRGLFVPKTGTAL